MSIIRKLGSVVADGTLGERQIRVVASDPSVDRVKDVMVPEGCILDGYKSNPIVLFNHDPHSPVGNAAVAIQNGRVEALIDFAQKGISAKADEVCGLYKSGVLRAVSVGFQPIEHEPIKDGGTRYTKWALMEISGCSVPANPNAVTIERSAAAASHTMSSENEPSSHWPTFKLTAEERRALDGRMKIRAQGLAELTGRERRAYYATEFPGLDYWDASKAYRERMDLLDIGGRFQERLAQSDFAKEYRRLAALSPEDRAAERRRKVRALTPPLGPWRWDQKISDAHNMAALRQWEKERQRRDYEGIP